MSSSIKVKPPQKLNGGKFELGKRLGAGCFGEVYRGVNTETKEEVAVKFENRLAISSPQLEHEVEVLNLVKQSGSPQGFAECFYFGREGPFNCMVMELLGKSLEDHMQSCGGTFTVKTTTLVAEQVLQRIEFLHSKGIVHRDIKPENFMFGTKGKIHHIYAIDFGLCKRFWDKQHVPMKQKLSLTGTARYASINAHKGMEQSRRDDLEAIGHMFMYFLRGALPWSGLEAKTQEEKYRKIREKKEQIAISELCKGYPEAYGTYLSYCRNLDFTEKPDYNMLFKLIHDCREAGTEDHQFQWLDPTRDPPGRPPQGPLVPLQGRQQVLQPDDRDKRSSKGCFYLICGGKSATRD